MKTSKNKTPNHYRLRTQKDAVIAIRGVLGWALTEWDERDGGSDQAVVELQLQEASLDLQALCWVLAHTPGCATAAVTVTRAADFTGDPARTLQELDQPPSDESLLRCMAGVARQVDQIEAQVSVLNFAASLMQTGMDINEARARNEEETARHLTRYARVARGCLATVLPFQKKLEQ